MNSDPFILQKQHLALVISNDSVSSWRRACAPVKLKLVAGLDFEMAASAVAPVISARSFDPRP